MTDVVLMGIGLAIGVAVSVAVVAYAGEQGMRAFWDLLGGGR